VLRRTLGLTALASMLLAWPSLGLGQQADALKRLRTTIHQDMTTCIAFFRLVGRCLAKNPQYAKTVAAYAKATDDLISKSILVGKQIGISDDDAKARLAEATDQMLELMRKDCVNLASLLHRHLDKCTAVGSDPLNPLKTKPPKP
jgi:hypothetical protein